MRCERVPKNLTFHFSSQGLHNNGVRRKRQFVRRRATGSVHRRVSQSQMVPAIIGRPIVLPRAGSRAQVKNSTVINELVRQVFCWIRKVSL